uniref:Ultraviolet-B-repressible protein n=1 Tax=Zea mays TaxID=4577 RepID=B6TQP8_MAIZE|nr:ultraviolet-B-repressible protein [Zea mays]
MAATASLSAVAAPLSVPGLRKPLGASSLRPLQPRAARMTTTAVRASASPSSTSIKEKAAAGLTAAALAAALVLPDVAEAAQSGGSRRRSRTSSSASCPVGSCSLVLSAPSSPSPTSTPSRGPDRNPSYRSSRLCPVLCLCCLYRLVVLYPLCVN